MRSSTQLKLSKVITRIGQAWIVLTGILTLLDLVATVLLEPSLGLGIKALIATLSPRNMGRYISTLLFLLPAIVCLTFADKLKKRAEKSSQVSS